MSDHTNTTTCSACPQCLRRGHLLGSLAPYIERWLSANPAGDVAALLAMRTGDLAEMLGAVLNEPDALTLADDVEAAGCWAVCQHSAQYPDALRALGDAAPAVLYGRGDLTILGPGTERVAIVGARRASSYGREVARELGRGLADARVAVVSGLAFGIDACAHRGALEAGRTVAVLGCGPDVAYPAAHRSLWRRVSEGGAVVSELPPGTGAWRWAFPARNRIIAALSKASIIVEASERSGTRHVTNAAQLMRRPVGAVPGPVGSRLSAGPNALIASGSQVIRGATDALRLAGIEEMPEPASFDLEQRERAAAAIAEDRVPAELVEQVAAYGE